MNHEQKENEKKKENKLPAKKRNKTKWSGYKNQIPIFTKTKTNNIFEERKEKKRE